MGLHGGSIGREEEEGSHEGLMKKAAMKASEHVTASVKASEQVTLLVNLAAC